MNRLVSRMGLFVAVAAAALAILAATFDVNKYRRTIQLELERRFGRPVIPGDVHFSIFPPRFGVQNPRIAEDPHFGAEAA